MIPQLHYPQVGEKWIIQAPIGGNPEYCCPLCHKKLGDNFHILNGNTVTVCETAISSVHSDECNTLIPTPPNLVSIIITNYLGYDLLKIAIPYTWLRPCPS